MLKIEGLFKVFPNRRFACKFTLSINYLMARYVPSPFSFHPILPIEELSLLHKLHRISACIIGAYIVVHLFNHLLALQSIEAHVRFMESFRQIYRHRLV